MIGRLTGVLAEKQPPFLLIDVNGVGYEVQAPMTSIYQLPALGERVTLFTHFSVSENAQQLFAFKDKDDRLLFRHLIKVSGVGPKLGLAILRRPWSMAIGWISSTLIFTLSPGRTISLSAGRVTTPVTSVVRK